MDNETCIGFCHSLAKAYSTAVRLYEGNECLYYYSVSHIDPDPLKEDLRTILSCREEAGIITTELCQFYGFLTLSGGRKIILGPTRIIQEDGRNTALLLAVLGIREEEKEDYLRLLRSAPIISADRFAWLLASLMTLLEGKVFPVERVWLQIRPESSSKAVISDYTRRNLDEADDADERETVAQSYAWEQLVLSYVENGETERLRELFSAPPNIRAGRIAHDGLRQMKNMGICTATGVSRAAIKGGVAPQLAFSMSDLYIQKLELMHSVFTAERLIQEMILDFSEQVEKLHHPKGEAGRFYMLYTRYVGDHLYGTIRASEMAEALGYTRSYLCTRFREEAGITLKEFIHKEKTAEAKRLLQFTDQDLGSIAAMLDYSSQSHFQTVFRKVTGETPMAFRRKTRPEP